MATLNKWNYKTKSYDEYEIPNEWRTPLLIGDLDAEVNCVQCGKKLKYGECYTSLEVHSSMGLGYGVCKECYDEEWKRKMRKTNVY